MSCPVDYFSGCIAFSKHVESILAENDQFCEVGDALQSRFKALAEIYSAVSEAMEGFDRDNSGWEGDVRDDELYVFALPSDSCETKIGFIWKQENNGSTFVASPYPLPWLGLQA